MGKLTKHNRIKALEKAWRRLYESNPDLSPFQAYDFNLIAERYSRLSPRRYHLKPVFYEYADDEGDTLLIAPLYVKNSLRGKTAFLFGDHMPASYSDFIYGMDLGQVDFDGAMAAIAKDLGNPLFCFNKVNESSQLSGFLLRTPTVDCQVRKNPCVMIPLSGDYESYWKGMSKSARQNLRTSRNRLRKDGLDCRMRLYVGNPLEPAVMEEIMAIYTKRFFGRRYGFLKSVLISFSKRRINPVTIALGRMETAFCSVLEIGGRSAAICTGFGRTGGKMVIPYLSMDESFSSYSPGGLLVEGTVKQLMDRGEFTAFDLGRGDEPYKTRYGGIKHANFAYTFHAGCGKKGAD